MQSLHTQTNGQQFPPTHNCIISAGRLTSTVISHSIYQLQQKFSTFVTLWTPQKFQARVADPTADGAPASTFRTPGWARTCLIKRHSIANTSEVFNSVRCSLHPEHRYGRYFCLVNATGLQFSGVARGPLEARRGPQVENP